MIHIEKLAANCENYTYETFTDLYYTASELNVYLYGIHSFLLKPYIEKKLSNVAIATHYGTKGIDLNKLLIDGTTVPNLVIETTIENLMAIPLKRCKSLLENHNVLLVDFFDGSVMIQETVDLLKTKNIKPKKLIVCTPSFNFNPMPEYTIEIVQFEFWPAATVTVDPFYRECLFNQDHRNNLLERIIHEGKKFALFPALKPRLSRLELLANLNENGILHQIDWSLGLNDNKSLGTMQIEIEQDLFSPKVKKLLDSFEFPRTLSMDVNGYVGNLIRPDHSWVGKYKWYISSETIVGDKFSELGECGFVSEKTYKAFIIGAVPFVHGPSNVNAHLEKLGFKTATSKTGIKNLTKAIASSADSEYDLDSAVSNFLRITDLDFIVDLAVAPLEEIATKIA